MEKLKSKLTLAVVLSTALVAGCSNGGGGGAPPAPNIGTTVSELVAFINNMIAGTDETSEPIDINGLTLVVDDTAEPSPVSF